jgi:hypothetical protein
LFFASYTYVDIHTGLYPLSRGAAIPIHLTIATTLSLITLSLITLSRRHSRYRHIVPTAHSLPKWGSNTLVASILSVSQQIDTVPQAAPCRQKLLPQDKETIAT